MNSPAFGLGASFNQGQFGLGQWRPDKDTTHTNPSVPDSAGASQAGSNTPAGSWASESRVANIGPNIAFGAAPTAFSSFGSAVPQAATHTVKTQSTALSTPSSPGNIGRQLGDVKSDIIFRSDVPSMPGISSITIQSPGNLGDGSPDTPGDANNL